MVVMGRAVVDALRLYAFHMEGCPRVGYGRIPEVLNVDEGGGEITKTTWLYDCEVHLRAQALRRS